MRRLDAIVLTSILGAVACATTVPIDINGLLAMTSDDGGVDAGFGGFGGGNAGFGSEFGSFPVGTGGSPFVSAGGSSGPPPSTGGRAAGPSRGAGGQTTAPPPTSMPPPTPTGGRSGAGGATGNGGAATGAGGAACREGEKTCGGVCVSPGPRTGCGLTGCDPCSITAPTNGVVICNGNHQCDVSCLSGYTKNGNTCEAPPPPPTGGGGSGGPAVSCGGQTCPSCTVILGPSCCTSAGKCGCPLIPWTGGILGCL